MCRVPRIILHRSAVSFDGKARMLTIGFDASSIPAVIPNRSAAAQIGCSTNRWFSGSMANESIVCASPAPAGMITTMIPSEWDSWSAAVIRAIGSAQDKLKQACRCRAGVILLEDVVWNIEPRIMCYFYLSCASCRFFVSSFVDNHSAGGSFAIQLRSDLGVNGSL